MHAPMQPLRAQDESDDAGPTDEEILAEEEVDAAVEDAKTTLRQWFSEHSEEVFYQQQLEVIFEKDYFHWVTRRALRELVAQTRLVLETVPLAGAIPLHVYPIPSNR